MSLAALENISIDIDRLCADWDHLYHNKIKKQDYDWRITTDLGYFHDYTQYLFKSIISILGIEPKNYIIQITDSLNIKEKNSLSIVHKDDDRKSCITIPIYYNEFETIMFYEDDPKIDWRSFSKSRKQWPSKPVKLARYSANHPTLVNVNQLHNVRIMDKTSHRVLLQLSFDETFEDIINRNPEIWKLM